MRLSSTPGASILLVEDDPDTARVITELLESRGHRVRRAESGAAARALAEELMPDLVLLDLILPDVDGLVLCTELRERVDMPVIICSGTQRQRDAVLGMKICADDFVAKPFDLDELAVRVLGRLAWGYWDRGLGRAVDTHLSHVRGKLERLAGEEAPAIVCVRGVGYSIVPRETAEADARAAS